MRKLGSTLLVLVFLFVQGVSAYPIARERELGERFDLEAAAKLPLVREATIVSYVNEMGRRIIDQLGSPQPFDYRFRVVRDPQLNAFAVPGGFIFIHTGLLTRVASDAELAGVLGHEIAHVHSHHIVRQQQKSQLLNYATFAGLLLSAIQPAIGAAAMGASATVQLKYQRDFEQEADFSGARFVREAGYDPRGLVSFMKRIADEQRTNPVNVPPYMLSHPVTDERITNLQATIREVPEQEDWREPSWKLRRVQAIARILTEDRSHVLSTYEKKAAGGSPREKALYGLVLLHHGDAESALPLLEGVAESGVPDLGTDLGFARLQTGDVAGAVRTLRGQVEAAPEDAVARLTLGLALLRSGLYEESREQLSRALELAPELVQAEEYLAQSYGRDGDRGRGFFHLARAQEQRGEIEKAVSNYRKAENLLPKNAPEREASSRRREVLEPLLAQRGAGSNG